MQQPVFSETHKNIGDIPEGKVVDIEYPMLLGSRIIELLIPDCGACTTMFNLGDKILLRFVAGNINPEVFADGLDKEPFDRGATVGFADGSTERLYFSGHIVKANG